MPKPDNRRLTITFARAGATAEIRIEDNGIGRQASALLQQGTRRANPSRGLSVTEQRLKLLREKYGWEIEMTSHDLADAAGRPAGYTENRR